MSADVAGMGDDIKELDPRLGRRLGPHQSLARRTRLAEQHRALLDLDAACAQERDDQGESQEHAILHPAVPDLPRPRPVHVVFPPLPGQAHVLKPPDDLYQHPEPIQFAVVPSRRIVLQRGAQF